MEELLKRAEQGDTDAMYQLGRGYQYAKFADSPDYEEAFRWFKKAAYMENYDAMAAMADAMSLGRGCERDLASASYWYQQVYDNMKRR